MSYNGRQVYTILLEVVSSKGNIFIVSLYNDIAFIFKHCLNEDQMLIGPHMSKNNNIYTGYPFFFTQFY